MADMEFIRRLQVAEGWSERRIAREFGYGRNTVHKLLDRSQPTTAPVYRRSKPVRAPKMDRYREIIDSWLIADQAAPRKQRHTAHRIHDRLVSEYDATDLAESSVRRYVRQRRELVAPKAAPAFLHLEFGPGQVAQVDWGEATVKLAGRQVTVWMFCMRLCHSTKPFVAVYPHGRMECFLEGHIQAFAWFGGIPAEIIYDNLGSAVQRVLSRRGRLLNAAFQAFVAHYLFKPVFANLAAGWEKGLVEGLVGTARRNYLVPVPDVSCLQEVNTHLRHGIDRDADHVVPERDGRSVRELFAEDRQGLIALPPSVFPACTRHSGTSRISAPCVISRCSIPFRPSWSDATSNCAPSAITSISTTGPGWWPATTWARPARPRCWSSTTTWTC